MHIQRYYNTTAHMSSDGTASYIVRRLAQRHRRHTKRRRVHCRLAQRVLTARQVHLRRVHRGRRLHCVTATTRHSTSSTTCRDTHSWSTPTTPDLRTVRESRPRRTSSCARSGMLTPSSTRSERRPSSRTRSQRTSLLSDVTSRHNVDASRRRSAHNTNAPTGRVTSTPAVAVRLAGPWM